MPGVGAVLIDGNYAPLVGVTYFGMPEDIVGLVSRRVATTRQRAAERIIEYLDAAKEEFRP